MMEQLSGRTLDVRWALVIVVAALAAMAGLVVTAPSASASARSCHVLVCNDTAGAGLRVDSVRASMTWHSRFWGHLQVWGPGIDANTGVGNFGDPYSWTVPINRNLPDESVVCVRAWEHTPNGIVQRGNACNTIRT